MQTEKSCFPMKLIKMKFEFILEICSWGKKTELSSKGKQVYISYSRFLSCFKQQIQFMLIVFKGKQYLISSSLFASQVNVSLRMVRCLHWKTRQIERFVFN